MDAVRARFRGCLLGGAVGDALGAPVEFLPRAEIERHCGAAGVRRYLPAFGTVGAITDDTQMTLFTAEGLLLGWADSAATGSADLVDAVRQAYLRWLLTQDENSPAGDASHQGWLLRHPELHRRRAPGLTCIETLEAWRRNDEDPARNDSKGCGGVMRVAPVGLFMWRPDGAFSISPAFTLAAELAGITHGHPTGRLSAGALAAMIAALADGMVLEGALAIARHLLTRHSGHEETLRALNRAESHARAGTPPTQAIPELGEGWVAEEALAIAVYCAMRAKSFEDGIIMAVNHDGDSDSTGSIAGQLLGAIHGAGAIPTDWLEPLELRSVITDTADRLATYWHAG